MAADQKLLSTYAVLYNRWGSPDSQLGLPKDGIVGAEHWNVATPKYPVGTVIQLYNTGATAGQAGYCQFVYIRVNTTAPTHAWAKGQILTPASATAMYTLTNDSDDDIAASTQGGKFAVCLGSMTDGYYGFAWCGGVCPTDFLTMTSTYLGVLAGDMAIGIPFALAALASSAAAYGSFGLSATLTAGNAVCGMALTADEAL